MENNRLLHPKELTLLFIISIVSSFFAYILILFVTNSTALYFAYDFDITGQFDFFNLTFDINRASDLWTYDAIVTIFMSQPISALVIGILSLLGLLFIRKKTISWFFLLMWLYLLAFNSGLGILIDDAIAETGTYSIAQLMNMNITILVVLSILVIYILYRIGLIAFYIFQLTFPKQYFNRPGNRFLFLFIVIIVPWLFMFLFPFMDSSGSYSTIDLLKNLSLIFILLPLFIGNPNEKRLNISNEGVSKPILLDLVYTLLFLAGTIALFFYMLHGVKF